MTRQAGFYWVYVKGEQAPEVAFSSGDGWLLAGLMTRRVEGVYVLSEQLWPPEQRSGCVHPAAARNEGRCLVCGTAGLG